MTHKYVAVTRAEHQNSELIERLAEHNIIALQFPCIQVRLPENPDTFDALLHNLAVFNTIIFTSANTVHAVRWRLDANNLSPDWDALTIVAVGTATANKVQELLGVTPDIVPEEQSAEGILAALADVDISGWHVCLPQSSRAKATLYSGLMARGAIVAPVTAYETRLGGTGVDDVPGFLRGGMLDAVTFTSPSTVDGYLLRLADVPQATDVLAACIGPTTAERARSAGFSRVIMPDHYTLRDMVERMVKEIKG